MVYIFDPTTCEEPTLPTYRYSPIPKAVECSCCPVYEEEGTEDGGIPKGNPPFLLIPDGPSTEEPKPIIPVRGASYNYTTTDNDDNLVLNLNIYRFSKGYLKDNEGNIYEMSSNNDGTVSVNVGPAVNYEGIPPLTVYAYNEDGTASEITTIDEYFVPLFRD